MRAAGAITRNIGVGERIDPPGADSLDRLAHVIRGESTGEHGRHRDSLDDLATHGPIVGFTRRPGKRIAGGFRVEQQVIRIPSALTRHLDGARIRDRDGGHDPGRANTRTHFRQTVDGQIGGGQVHGVRSNLLCHRADRLRIRRHRQGNAERVAVDGGKNRVGLIRTDLFRDLAAVVDHQTDQIRTGRDCGERIFDGRQAVKLNFQTTRYPSCSKE